MSIAQRILVIGGARSGKSRYAENLAPDLGSLTYIATAEALDDEMKERIAEHRRDRGERWTTVDAPHDLSGAIAAHAKPGAFVLVDCITLWLANIMMAEHDCAIAVRDLVKTISAAQGKLVLVTNEVGLSIVPENALARRFRDEAGRANQQLAAICDDVTFIAAGLPLHLKQAR